jgi:hypothetical protein
MSRPPGAPLVVLVHNHQPDRNAYAIPRLETLCESLGATYDSVSWQPPIRPVSRAAALARDIASTRLEVAWSRYRGASLGTIRRVLTNNVRARLPKYFSGKGALDTWRRRLFIEAAVTAKHLSAWHLLLESNSPYLICCEDDVVFEPDSIERLRAVLVTDLPAIANPRFYLDLAGGMSASELQIEDLVQSRGADRIHYRYPVTNSACSYLISRPLAADFLAQTGADPTLRLLGIDWMMNAMFMAQRQLGLTCECIHFSPPVFRHGTFTGEYASWQRTG